MTYDGKSDFISPYLERYPAKLNLHPAMESPLNVLQRKLHNPAALEKGTTVRERQTS
jgi:hypothetical protein